MNMPIFRKMHAYRGSHLPVLAKVMLITSGPVAELGCGMYSTPFLHWLCYPYKRSIVTYENSETYLPYAQLFEADFHKICFVPDWNSLDLSGPCSVAFIDHAPDTQRVEEIKRLVHADYVVAHDADNKTDGKYRYSTVYKLFKYRWKYTDARPHTIVFSNKYDLKRFTVG